MGMPSKLVVEIGKAVGESVRWPRAEDVIYRSLASSLRVPVVAWLVRTSVGVMNVSQVTDTHYSPPPPLSVYIQIIVEYIQYT